MVSKVAVIALVAIVACPILLGYAMNLNEITVNEYKTNNDSVNVTPLLQTNTAWTYANGDTNTLNGTSAFGYMAIGSNSNLPIYNSVTTTKTSVPYRYIHINNWTGGAAPLAGYKTYGVNANYAISPSLYCNVTFYNGATPLYTINYFTYYYLNLETNWLYYWHYYSTGSQDGQWVSYKLSTTPTSADYYVAGAIPIDYYYVSAGSYFADPAAGWYFNKTGNQPIHYWVNFPGNTTEATVSIDLDSIVDSNFSVQLWMPIPYLFEKTTVAGVAKYTLKSLDTTTTPYTPDGNIDFELYYDPSRTDNTYQFHFSVEKTSQDSSYKYYNNHIDCYYVGGWPTIIGQANAYITYSGDESYYTNANIADNFIYSFGIMVDSNAGNANLTRTPTMRVDAARFRAFEYSIVENAEYTPSSFKNNPSTEIKLTGSQIGESLTFGGQTYQTSGQDLIFGTHKIPINGLVLDSIPNVGGGYDNRINGTVISNTVAPSTITFSGQWAVSISTDSMVQTTYTKTEWTAGEFGWDGIDHNFLMVGLLTSVGVFIALGIYIRRTKANLWPLLLVCGGAAMLFFCML